MVAEIVVAGEQSVDWGTALRALRSTARAGVLLVEGGPTTNAQLLAADFVDELCLTVSPNSSLATPCGSSAGSTWTRPTA